MLAHCNSLEMLAIVLMPEKVLALEDLEAQEDVVAVEVVILEQLTRILKIVNSNRNNQFAQ